MSALPFCVRRLGEGAYLPVGLVDGASPADIKEAVALRVGLAAGTFGIQDASGTPWVFHAVLRATTMSLCCQGSLRVRRAMRRVLARVRAQLRRVSAASWRHARAAAGAGSGAALASCARIRRP